MTARNSGWFSSSEILSEAKDRYAHNYLAMPAL
jgi:hypothetical protein